MFDLPLDLTRTLLAVVDEGTLDAAARSLHVTPSAVSQRLKALEKRTGRVLVQRTKPVRLTESGETVVRLARQVMHLEQAARGALGLAPDGEPVRLSVAVNADSLATWFLPALAAAAERVNACFELHREDEDHTAELLRSGRAMAAVTSSPDPVQGCRAHSLGRLRYYAMASPDLIARRLSGGPLSSRLPTAPVVNFDRKDVMQERFARRVTKGRTYGPLRHYVPSSEAFLGAVTAGLGWGMLPAAQADPLRASGALVDLDKEHPEDVPLYWQQWKLDSPALTALADAVVDAASGALIVD